MIVGGRIAMHLKDIVLSISSRADPMRPANN